MFPGIRSLGGWFQNRTCQCWVQRGRMSEQKWLLPVSVSSCLLSGRHFQIFKWVSFTYGVCTFNLVLGCPFPVVLICLDILPCGFHSHVFWELFPPVQDVRVRVPNKDLKYLDFKGKVLTLRTLLTMEQYAGSVCSLVRMHVESVSLPLLSFSVLCLFLRRLC